MSDTPETQPKEAEPAKSLELTDLPANKEGENVKGGIASVYPGLNETECTSGLLSTCAVKVTTIDTWCNCVR